MNSRKEQIESRLSKLPKGKVSYKKIKGVEQPYLQWKENGKLRCDYIKVADRERIFLEIEERERLESELNLLNTYSEKICEILSNNPRIKDKSALGYQRFDEIINNGIMYVDKTSFIEEWLSCDDQVSLITRPRRFGKTLMMSTVECFFSTKYAGRSDLFADTYIVKNREIMKMQGTIPVISITLAGMKAENFVSAMSSLSFHLYTVFAEFSYLLDSDRISNLDKEIYKAMLIDLSSHRYDDIADSVYQMCRLLYLHHGRKVLVIFDEYDTPMVEAFFAGFWDELASVIARLFRNTFKTNQFLYKGLMTGITRISKESLFSDLNNIRVHSILSGKFGDCFGFSENEVRSILEIRDMDVMESIKHWYDGYTIAGVKDIYNPWAILSFLSDGLFMPYWANSGGTKLINRLLEESDSSLLIDFDALMSGRTIRKYVDEHISFDSLFIDNNNVWSLLLASGYLKADNLMFGEKIECDLSITNVDAKTAFGTVIKSWFSIKEREYNSFCNALLVGDVEMMSDYINDVFASIVSCHDIADEIEHKKTEKFYHGLVLGMIVSLSDKYEIKSNRESGYGRFDIMMRPKQPDLDGIIIEFKVFDKRKDADMLSAAMRGLKQIEDKRYDAELVSVGLDEEQIKKYCFVFNKKEALVVSF